MNRTRISLLNAISAVVLTVSNGLWGLVLTRLLITSFGSDFNGISSTATQLVNVLLILEGGFTLAINVSLFIPYINKDYKQISSIFTATEKIFKLIGIAFMLLGVVIAFIYAIIVNTELDRRLIFYILIMTFLPNAVNLYFTMKYRVLIQAEQKEYIISGITFVTSAIAYILNILLLLLNISKMWYVRTIISTLSLINSAVICFYAKRKYKFIDRNAFPSMKKITGTKDVVIQKITGALYSTLPIVFISVSNQGGTVLASVYAVYNNVFNLIKNIMYAAMNAPRLALGQVIAEGNENNSKNKFLEYELLSIYILTVMSISTSGLIIPFIRLYIGKNADTNYIDKTIAVLLSLTMFFEVIHIPSGHIINMSGQFKKSKQYQLIACVILFITIFVGVIIGGIYGIVFGVTLTAFVLAMLEIQYVHIKYYPNTLPEFSKMAASNVLMGILLLLLESPYFHMADNVLKFILIGAALTIFNAVIIAVVNYFINNKNAKEILKLAITLFRIKK